MTTNLNHMIPLSAARQLGEQLQAAGLAVDWTTWQAAVGKDFDQLGLMDRGRRLAEVLTRFLPADFAQAARLLVASMGRPMGLDHQGEPTASGDVPSSFFYLPHSLYIGSQGLGHLTEALQAQHALTQRFTAEFSLRPFLLQHTTATLAHLAKWTTDPNAHVRRAVSEATRPRLPWAPRLPAFVRDPTPVLPLLLPLRDDASSYVRRSVANHLNDIGKDHPQRLTDLARTWLTDSPVPPSRTALLRHALRTAIKKGETDALALFGHGQASLLRVQQSEVSPDQASIGGHVTLSCQLHNPTPKTASALADWRVHYVKSDGSQSVKVFKGSTVELPPQGQVVLQKTLSLRQMSTRTHHPGRHRVEIALNGHAHPVGHFDLHA